MQDSGTRPFLEKVAQDNRTYVQALLDENQRLGRLVAELEIECDHTRTALSAMITELNSREKTEAVLEERVRTIEEESRRFSERYVEVEQQNTNLANLYVASYQLNGTLDRERVLEAIKEIVINLIGSEELAIWEINDESSALSLVGSFGIDPRSWAGVPLGWGVIGEVGRTGARFVARDSTLEPAPHEDTLTACIPLRLDDRVIGAIGIFSLLQQKQCLEAVDYELFDLLGSHAASALFCTRLYQVYAETAQ